MTLRVPADPVFNLRELSWRSSRLWQTLAATDTCFVGRGRQALRAAISVLALQPGDAVLLPAYICREAAAPFSEAGIECRYYRQHLDLSPDRGDVEAQADDSCRAMLMINYFGAPCDIAGYHTWLASRRQALIEDNAHGMLATAGGEVLGLRADLGVFSFSKAVGVPASGAIVVTSAHAKKGAFGPLAKPSGTLAEVRFCAFGICRAAVAALPAVLQSLARRPSPPARPSQAAVPPDLTPRRIGPLSKFLVKHTGSEKLANERCRLFADIDELVASTAGVELAPLTGIRESDGPLCYPLWSADGEATANHLIAGDINARTWPDLPAAVMAQPERYTAAHTWRRHLTCLPLHASVGRADRYLARLTALLQHLPGAETHASSLH